MIYLVDGSCVRFRVPRNSRSVLFTGKSQDEGEWTGEGEQTRVTESRSTGMARWDKSIPFRIVYFARVYLWVSTFRGYLLLRGRDL